MAQINNTRNGGTVNVTNGSNVVTAVGIDLITLGVLAGNSFKVVRVSGERTDYTIASAPVTAGNNQTFTLTASYSGTTGTGLGYAITTGFTTNRGYAEVDLGDVDWAVAITRTLRQIDADLSDAISGSGWKGGYNADTDTPALPAAATDNNGWFYRVTVAGTVSRDGVGACVINDGLLSTGAAWVRVPAPTAGAAGTDGKTVLTTSGAPSNSVGVNGDFAYDPTAMIMYGPKTGGAWDAGTLLKGGTGEKGDRGLPGNAVVYNAATTYAQNDQVYVGSDIYYSLQASNLNHDPASSPTWWQIISTGIPQLLRFADGTVNRATWVDTGEVDAGGNAVYAVQWERMS